METKACSVELICRVISAVGFLWRKTLLYDTDESFIWRVNFTFTGDGRTSGFLLVGCWMVWLLLSVEESGRRPKPRCWVGFFYYNDICVYEKVYDQVFLINRGFSNARAFIFVRPPTTQATGFIPTRHGILGLLYGWSVV